MSKKLLFILVIAAGLMSTVEAQNNGNKPLPSKNEGKIQAVTTTQSPQPGVIQQKNPETNEQYKIEFTVMLIQGRKTIDLARKQVLVTILFTDGFYITIPVDRTSNDKTLGVGSCFRKVSDTAISRIEVVYVNKKGNASRDEWELYDVLVRGFAFKVTDPSKNFIWDTRNFFPGLQILLPGQVAESIVRKPMRLSDYARDNYYISMLYPQFIIGNDDIRDNYSALNMVITTRSNPSVIRKSPVAPKPDNRTKLKGAYSFFALTETEMRAGFPYAQSWPDASGAKIPLGAKIADLNKISLEYEYGDHGPFENDDWDLAGICLNIQLQNNTGYRYYTNWKLNKRMNRSSRVDLQ
ncbi:MAG: hypothetical protein U0T11_02430 [Chitinophagaceae bacterium]